MMNASSSNSNEGRVGKFRPFIVSIANSAVVAVTLPWRTAFHKIFANSAQNRSGTTNRTSPFAYRRSKPRASSVRVSPAAGRNHFAATLASTTSRVTGTDPLFAFPHWREKDRPSGAFGIATVAPDGETAAGTSLLRV